MKDKNDNSKLIDDKRKHKNDRPSCSWFRLPTDVIPPNFGSKSRRKLK